MAAAAADAALDRLVHDTSSACATAGHPVSDAMAAFLVRSVILDPQRTGGHEEKHMSAEEMAAIVSAATAAGAAIASPRLRAVDHQLRLAQLRLPAVNARRRQQAALDGSLRDLETQICKTSGTASKAAQESLYHEMVTYTLLKAQLGDPTNLSLAREARAALESVLPPAELPAFLALAPADRLEQLADITLIVSGIRLFNKMAGKGGAAIPDLVNTLVPSVQTLLGGMTSLAEEAQNLYSAVASCKTEQPQFLAAQCVASSLLLLGSLAKVCGRLQQVTADVRAQFQAVSNAITNKAAVPTDIVYPLFMALAKLWSELQGSSQDLDMMAEFQSNQRAFVEYARPLLGLLPDEFAPTQFLRQRITELAAACRAALEGQPPADATNWKSCPEAELLAGSEVCVLVSPRTANNYAQLPVQLGGFCPVAFAGNGLRPVFGNPLLGLLKYKEKLFAFSSREAAAAFASDPDRWLSQVLLRARGQAEYVDLLELYEWLRLEALSSGGPTAPSLVTKCDGGTQTDTHLLPAGHDRSYEWNEWELRRKALKLADLRKKQTHSTQTDKSYHRRDNTTQVYLPKTQSSQTRTDAGTNTAKPANYIKGLRGHTGAKAEPAAVVDLTLAVGGKSLAPSAKAASSKKT